LENHLRDVSLEFMLRLESEAEAEALYKAILPEIESPVDEKRGKIKAYRRGSTVYLKITSKSLSDLRALLNTYAYLLESLRKVVIKKL
jgi:tRNA threonylcarbamoyladenosine modification (KEOPS) complex  Pcc1 subunit